MIEDYHPLVVNSRYIRYLIDDRIVIWHYNWPPGQNPIYLSYWVADSKEARALARLLHRRNGLEIVLTPPGEPAPSDFGS